MAIRIDKFTEDRVKLSANMYQVLDYYGFELKKVGSIYFTRCPFHGDNNPSMSITPDYKSWRCWACSELDTEEKHDHIGFVMKYRGLSYPEALEELARIYGIIIPENGEQPRGWVPPTPVQLPERPKPEPTYTNPAVMRATMREYESNPLYIFLSSLFDPRSVYQVFMRYYVGTANHRLNPEQNHRKSTVFWQVDASGRVRGGKIVAYDHKTGKRIRSASGLPVYWVHKLLHYNGYVIDQCLFGAHLITEKTERVNVVESEKSALLAALYFGGESGVWVATGGKTSSPLERILEAVPGDGARVVLYPDADAVAQWAQICAELKEIGLEAELSNIMDNEPAGSKNDIGDFIVRQLTGGSAASEPQQNAAAAPCAETNTATATEAAAVAAEEPEPDYTEPNKMQRSVKRCEDSNLYTYLTTIFDPNSVRQAFTRYNVGHDYDLDYCTAFWQVDEAGRIRAAKIVSHDPKTGKRFANPVWCAREDGACWHFDLPLCYVKYNLKQCLFGQHLIRDASRINIVTLEEDAVKLSLKYGDALGAWVATGTEDPEQCAKLIREAAHLINGKDLYFYTDAAARPDYVQLYAQLQSMGVSVGVNARALSDLPVFPDSCKYRVQPSADI